MATALEHLVEEPDSDSLIWPIKKKSLIGLDKIRNELNSDLSRLEHQVEYIIPSRVTGERILDNVRQIIREASRIRPGTQFEEILREDILKNAASAEAYYNLLFNYDEPETDTGSKKYSNDLEKNMKNFNVVKFLRDYYGEKVPVQTPYATIIRLASHFNHGDIDTYAKKVYKIIALSKEIYIEGLFSKAKNEILPFTRDIILLLGDFLDIPRESLNIKVEMDITNRKYSYFHSGTFYASIDPNEIYYYREDGVDKEFTGSFLLEALHEGTHGLHQIISENSFPGIKGIAPMDDAYNGVHMPLTEGIARMNERFLIPLIVKKNKEKFRLTDQDIEAMFYISKFDLARRIPPTLFSILKVRENTELQERNAIKELSRIIDMPLYLRDQAIIPNESLLENLYNVGTIIGTDYVKRCFKQLNSKYGRDTVDKNMSLILRGFLTGSWQLPTHYKFLTQEYLPRAEKFFK